MHRLVVLAVLFAAPAARADEVDDAVAPARVTASLHGLTARFEVRVHAASLASEQFPAATLDLALPARGIVTHAVAFAGGKPHALALMPSEAASAAFWAIGAASGEHHAWGVLVSAAGDTAQIDIASGAEDAAASLDVVLQIEAPTCFERDARWVQVPASWRGALATVAAPAACGDAGRWVRFAAPMSRDVRIGTIAGRLSVPGADFARVEIDLANELADVPADLATAIVVDGSRSVTADEREEQRAIIASYLQKTSHTRVQLVEYDRRARALLPAWATTDAAAARIDRELRALRGRNGSNIDVGISEAAAWLARVDGTRRVIVFTDERVAARLEDETGEAWRAGLPPGTLVHVVALRDDKPSASPALVRDDGVQFAALAQATGGISVSGSLVDPHAADALDATLLARPISLDHVEVHGEGWTGGSPDCGATDLPEGTSCVYQFGHAVPSAGPIEIDGLLWNLPMKRIVVPDRSQARAIARELSAAGGLETTLQADVDRAAHAVNAAWSLYASWGGDGGYAQEFGFTRGGAIGGTHDMSIVDTIGTAHTIPTVDLSSQLAGPLAACGPDAHGQIAIELTDDEIVDVAVSDAGPHAACLEDAVWNTLVALPDAHPRSRAVIDL